MVCDLGNHCHIFIGYTLGRGLNKAGNIDKSELGPVRSTYFDAQGIFGKCIASFRDSHYVRRHVHDIG